MIRRLHRPTMGKSSEATPAMTQPSPNAPQPQPGDGRERRKFRRARLDLPITISLDDGDHEAKIRDVSRGGVCFFLDRPVPEMTALRVEFELPTEHGRRKITGDGPSSGARRSAARWSTTRSPSSSRTWPPPIGRRSSSTWRRSATDLRAVADAGPSGRPTCPLAQRTRASTLGTPARSSTISAERAPLSSASACTRAPCRWPSSTSRRPPGLSACGASSMRLRAQ